MASREEMLARRKASTIFTPSTNLVEKTKNMDIDDTPLSDIMRDVNAVMESAKENPDEIPKAKADEFIPFPDEKLRLKLHTGYKREVMVESIKMDGIMLPILVWLKDGEKIILSGHNRVDIARELDIEIPYIGMKDLSYEKAKRIVVVQNLYNRQHTEMQKSEISNMLKVAIGTYDESKTKSEIYEALENEFHFTRKQVLAYLKIQALKPFLMQMLDDGKMPMDAAYNIAQADDDKQETLIAFVQNNNITKISMKHADNLMARKVGDWDTDFMMAAFGLVAVKKTGRKATSVKIKYEDLTEYIPNESMKHATDIIKDSLKVKKELEALFEEYDKDIDMVYLKEALDYYKNKR